MTGFPGSLPPTAVMAADASQCLVSMARLSLQRRLQVVSRASLGCPWDVTSKYPEDNNSRRGMTTLIGPENSVENCGANSKHQIMPT